MSRPRPGFFLISRTFRNMECTEIAIAGGGLAGLTAAIELKRMGREVTVFEKHRYPRHKVCGEYLSTEVLPYLESIGVDLSDAPRITRLRLQSGTGRPVWSRLPLGGLGISRFALDHRLYEAASRLGVRVRFETIREVRPGESGHILSTDAGNFRASHILAAWGKRSNLDRQQERPFFGKKTQWMAIKNHYEAAYPPDQVGLYTFSGGYGGVSVTETGAVNFCFLIRQERFSEFNSPASCCRGIIAAHPGLREALGEAKPVFPRPLAISQISFDAKQRHSRGMLFAGDAAQLIHPLTGNGMAMAILGGRMASRQIGPTAGTPAPDNRQATVGYEGKWERAFRSRLRSGRVLQWFLTRPRLTDSLVGVAGAIPGVLPRIVSKTHGKPLHP